MFTYVEELVMPRVGKSSTTRDCVVATRVPEYIAHWIRAYAKREGKSVSDVVYEWILDLHERDMKQGISENERLRKSQ